MHVVVFQFLFFHGAEGAQADVQRHLGDGNAFLADPFKQFFRKMQPRCGRRRAPVVLRVYRLIAVFVLKLVCDIGRERHFSERVQHLLEDPFILKMDEPVAFVRVPHDLAFEPAVAEHKPRALAAFLAWLHQSLPDVIFETP